MENISALKSASRQSVLFLTEKGKFVYTTSLIYSKIKAAKGI